MGVIQAAAIPIGDPASGFLVKVNADGSISFTQATLTPAAPNGGAAALQLQAGATSQTLFAAGEISHGAIVVNGASATDQGGIAAAEEIWIDITGAAAVTTPGGTSIPVLPGGSFTIPAKLTTAVNWIATTVNHKICAVKY